MAVTRRGSDYVTQYSSITSVGLMPDTRAPVVATPASVGVEVGQQVKLVGVRRQTESVYYCSNCF